MSIRITLPGGVLIETDTLAEAVAVARALAPGALAAGSGIDLEAEPGKKRTRILTTNGDLLVLEAWGITTEEGRKALSYEDWAVVANELGRSIDASQSLAQRYVWGVYTSSGSDPTAKAVVHAENDRSRVKSEA